MSNMKRGTQSFLSVTDSFNSLNSARFLKTIRGKSRFGHVVVKIFVKPSMSVSVAKWVRQLGGTRLTGHV